MFSIVWILIAVVSLSTAGLLTTSLCKSAKGMRAGDFFTYYPGISGDHYWECINNKSVVEYYPSWIILCLGLAAGVILHMISPLAVRAGYLIAFIIFFCMALGGMNAYIFCEKYMHKGEIDEDKSIGKLFFCVIFSALSLVFLVFFLVTANTK